MYDTCFLVVVREEYLNQNITPFWAEFDVVGIQPLLISWMFYRHTLTSTEMCHFNVREWEQSY